VEVAIEQLVLIDRSSDCCKIASYEDVRRHTATLLPTVPAPLFEPASQTPPSLNTHRAEQNPCSTTLSGGRYWNVTPLPLLYGYQFFWVRIGIAVSTVVVRFHGRGAPRK